MFAGVYRIYVYSTELYHQTKIFLFSQGGEQSAQQYRPAKAHQSRSDCCFIWYFCSVVDVCYPSSWDTGCTCDNRCGNLRSLPSLNRKTEIITVANWKYH